MTRPRFLLAIALAAAAQAPSLGAMPPGVSSPEAPVLDGVLTAGEWDGARRERLEGGGEVLLLVRDGDLYVAVRGESPGLAHLCVGDEEHVAVLHASAALGQANYQRAGAGFSLRDGFDWQLRDPPGGGAATAREAEFWEAHAWLANPSRTGATIREFRIARSGGRRRLAAAFLELGEPMRTAHWPAAVADGCRTIELLRGETADPQRFAPASWLDLGELAPPACRVGPLWRRIELPASGLHWLPGEFDSGGCPQESDEAWQRAPSAGGELLVRADGPGGSGRYWTVTVARPGADGKPARGVCFMTTTVGWRTLQDFGGRPLPWLEDRDGDGLAELVVWASYPLDASESPATQALVGWVYRLTAAGVLQLDESASRRLAKEVAAAYRLPSPSPADYLLALRARAASALEELGAGACSLSAP